MFKMFNNITKINTHKSLILQALSKHKLLIPLCSSNPTKTTKTTKTPIQSPIATTPNDCNHNQSPHTTHCPPHPHTHAWVRVKPVCEAVYTASLCVTTITHQYPQHATNPVTMRFPTSPTP